LDTAAWAVLAGAIAGAAISGLTSVVLEWRRGSHESRLDKERREDDRRIERGRIQRQNLLELQECLARFVRAIGAEAHFDVMSLRRQGTMTLLPDELDSEIFEAHRELGYRIERVTNEPLRSVLEAFWRAATRMETSRVIGRDGLTEGEIDAALAALVKQYEAARGLMGAVLREYL
jgi:hypothetical protein